MRRLRHVLIKITHTTSAMVAALAILAIGSSTSAEAGDQTVLDISNDMTSDVVRVALNTDRDGNLTGFDIAGEKFDLNDFKAGAKLVYKNIFLLTAKSPDLNPATGGAIDLICAAGERKVLRLQLKRDQNGHWAVFARGRATRELKLVIELNWKMKPTGAKDIRMVSLDLDPNKLLAALNGPRVSAASVNDLQVKQDSLVREASPKSVLGTTRVAL